MRAIRYGQIERFGQIVVRAGGEALQHVGGVSARGQDQRRHELTGMAHVRNHFEAALARQHHIEHDDIEILRRRQKQRQCRFTAVDYVDLIAFGFQIEAQAVGQMLLVFHYENAAHFAIGNCSVNVLPCPGPSLSAHARPPWRLATERTM